MPALGRVAVLALGGWLALHGRISLGTFLAFTSYLGSFVTPVRQVATLLTVWQQARAGTERVLEVIDEAPAITDAPGAADLPPGPPALSWQDVTFGYGAPDATQEQIRAAAAIARADEFVQRLPQGYDTVVGEQGLTLSGG